MALLQITEPGAPPKETKPRLAAGIDLGTTNSLVAIVQNGVPGTLEDAEGRHLLPSVVHYSDAGHSTGHAAREHAASDPANTVISAKRMLGRGLADITRDLKLPYEFLDRDTGMPQLLTAAGPVNPVQVSADILKALSTRAREALGGDLAGVVVTVPAYFDDAQRQATRDAAEIAGLRVLRLLNEPTAAAVAYGLDSGDEGLVAVYDLGGGTFDISLLRLHQGVFEVLATGGDSALGGDDLDERLALWLLAKAGVKQPDQQLTSYLMLTARDIKEQMSSQDQVAIHLQHPGLDWQGHISRTEFDGLIADLIERTLVACRKTLRDAGLKAEEVDQLVLVGGSTRVPLLRQKVSACFGREPLSGIDPDRVVALGAALQADILAGNKSAENALLLDVLPLSLGVEMAGGLVEKMIPRNTAIPVSKARDFTTSKNGQTRMLIHVLQGERELVSDCRSLARFELQGIAPMAAGAASVRVTFQVDADGLLSVSAREETSGVQAEVQVKPSYGLAEEEVRAMLEASITHAGKDVAERRLAEARVDAERLLQAVLEALQTDGKLLDAAEQKEINTAVSALQAELQGTDASRMEEAVQKLGKATENFAALRMNQTVKSALAGRKLDEILDK